MPSQPPNSSLGSFLAALREAKIECILIGNMAAIRHGAPLMTVDLPILERTLRLARRLQLGARQARTKRHARAGG